MTHGGPLHPLGKSALALHISADAHGHNGVVVYPELNGLRRLRLDELVGMHRELHEDVPAVRDAAWPTAPGIPVPDAFEGLAASRTAAPGTDGGSGSAAPAGQVTPGPAGAPQRRPLPT